MPRHPAQKATISPKCGRTAETNEACQKSGLLPRCGHLRLSTDIMRFLLRLAFWLTVVVYNLPTPESEPAPANRRVAKMSQSTNPTTAQTRSASCAQSDRTAQASQRPVDPPNNGSLRRCEQASQNTLRLSDLARPWQGPTDQHLR